MTISSRQQVRLRPTSTRDVDFVLATERHPDNAPFIRQWSEDQHRRAIADENIAHAIVEAVSGERAMGYVILCGAKSRDRSVEFKRIAIAEKARGFGRGAVRAVKTLAFEQLGAHRLWLEVVIGNNRARRLYDSEGFRVEGTLREAAWMQDRFESLTVMSMLESEYRSSVGADGCRALGKRCLPAGRAGTSGTGSRGSF